MAKDTAPSHWDQNSAFESDSYSTEQWRTAVEQVLKGADFSDALVTGTLDGIEIQPLYQQEPDAPTYTRGDGQWSIQQIFSTGTLGDTNSRIISDLEAGLTSIELTLSSQKSDITLPCHSVADLDHLLTGVFPQMVELSLTPGSDNRLCGALLLAWYYRQKIAADQIRCALNWDPLGALATSGISSKSLFESIEPLAAHCSQHFPNASSLCVDSSVYHNAGCTAAQELAFMLATSVEYLRHLSALDINTAMQQIRYRIALDADFFNSVAKLRSARELIDQVAAHCGATDSNSKIDTIGSSRSFARLDPSVNILRNTTQTFAAMVGGANGFVCTPYDGQHSPSSTASRLARNTHNILIEESGILNVHDPMRGSGFIESLSHELSSTAWSLFQQIESEGGMLEALKSGLIKRFTDDAAKQRSEDMSHGNSVMVGVTEYPNLNDDADLIQDSSLSSGTNVTTDSGVPLANTQSGNTVSQSLSVSALIGALAEGESTLAHSSSTQNSDITIDPVRTYRDAEIFEQLRARSLRYKEAHGRIPTLTIVTLGDLAEYAARADYCKRFFAIAGIETIQTSLSKYSSDNDSLVLLCASDKKYDTEALDACASIQCDQIWIAGNHPELLKQLAEHGVTEKIHLGCDRITLLEKALTALGVK